MFEFDDDNPTNMALAQLSVSHNVLLSAVIALCETHPDKDLMRRRFNQYIDAGMRASPEIANLMDEEAENFRRILA